MHVPLLKKIQESNDILIERALPNEGEIDVKVGDKVEPFDELGSCKASYAKFVLPSGFLPMLEPGITKVSEGAPLGEVAKEVIKAPFDGNLVKENDTWVLKEDGKHYELFSGVWGTIDQVFDKYSVQIKTQTKDILVPIMVGDSCCGELIVFPNPSDLLMDSFLEKFTNDAVGKIFYVGNHANADIVSKAQKLGAKAVLAGSVSKEAVMLAKNEHFNLGSFEGFGQLATSDIVYNELKDVLNRYVFIQAERHSLRIPMPKPFKEKKGTGYPLVLLKKGVTVQVYEEPYFGQIGTVDSVSESSIFVKLLKNSKSVEVRKPNFFALE